jgi:hypothetical protein
MMLAVNEVMDGTSERLEPVSFVFGTWLPQATVLSPRLLFPDLRILITAIQ